MRGLPDSLATVNASSDNMRSLQQPTLTPRQPAPALSLKTITTTRLLVAVDTMHRSSDAEQDTNHILKANGPVSLELSSRQTTR